jgi:hypothetical protein
MTRVDEDSIRTVVEELKRRGERVSEMRALDVFGGDGLREMVYWGNDVKELEVWEIIPSYEEGLKKLFPKARVLIVDTYQEASVREAKFDLIVVDNPSSICSGGHYEHFDLFPIIFRLCKDGTTLILNIIPALGLDEGWLDKRRHNLSRKRFYGAHHFNRAQMIQVYSEKAKESGFNLAWSFLQQRGGSDTWWLVLKLAQKVS